MSNNLGRTEVAASQNQKEVTINDSDGALDAAITETTDLDFTSADVTLTNSQFRGAFQFRATNLGVARDLTVPVIKRFFFVNNAAGSAILSVVRGTTSLDIAAGESGLFYTDGTTNGLIAAGSASSSSSGSSTFVDLTDTPANYTGQGGKVPAVNSGESALEFIDKVYDLGGAFGGVPGTSVVLFQFVFPRAAALPAGATNSQGKAGVAATAQTDIDIRKNNVSIGTMRFAAAGTTATFVSVSATSFAAGDELTLVSPSSADATLANLSFTMACTR